MSEMTPGPVDTTTPENDELVALGKDHVKTDMKDQKTEKKFKSDEDLDVEKKKGLERVDEVADEKEREPMVKPK